MTTTGTQLPRNISAVGRNTAVMAVGTTLSRVTGVLRIFALTYAIGAGAFADAYNLANTIPNIIHDIVLGGLVSATFIPVFVERLSTRKDEEVREALSAVASVTLLVIGAATVVFLILTPFIIAVTTALNHSPSAHMTRQVATDLLFLFVPQLACYGVISLATALLNASGRFAAPMFAPVANNVALVVVLMIFATVVRTPSLFTSAHHRGQILLLGLGTTFAVVAQAAVMVPSIRRANLGLRWHPNFRHEAVRRILHLSSWTFGLVLANQLALVVILVMSQKVGPGAVSAYTYAYTFFQLPYGIVAVSIMAATSPALAASWAIGDSARFRRRMTLGLQSMLALIIPSAAGLVVLARPVVALLLGHGAATPASTVPTAQSLAMLSLGLPGFCVFLYAIRILQSVQNLRAAFWLYVLENAINIVLAIALAGPLGVRGIALSISVAYTVGAVLALMTVQRLVETFEVHLLRPLWGVLAGSAVLVVVTAMASNVSNAQRGVGLLGRVVLGTLSGALVYFVTVALFALFRRGHDGGHGPPSPRTLDKEPDPNAGPTRAIGRYPAPPARPEPPPRAGRPPMRPGRLGPTRRVGEGAKDGDRAADDNRNGPRGGGRGRLDR